MTEENKEIKKEYCQRQDQLRKSSHFLLDLNPENPFYECTIMCEGYRENCSLRAEE